VLWVINEQLTVYRQGASYAQAFSGSHIDFVGNEIELLLAVARQIGALGQVLADQAVGVCIGAALALPLTAPLRLISRLIVLGERPNARAISLTPLLPCSMVTDTR